jgi:glyoxylase-like metal-dependent hydrolase (beta-lactamase superfamily II)
MIAARIATSVSLAALAALCAAVGASAQGAPNFDEIEIKTNELADGLYMLEGQGGNIAVSVGEDGVLMVDDQFAPLADKIKAAIAALTDEPVRFVVNTHHHGDHNGGNAAFGADGATIVATQATRERIRAGFESPAQGEPQPVPEHALPTLTYSGEIVFHLNGETIRVFQLEPAHTDGDTFVYFENAGVLHMGDVFRTTSYQGADVAGGGSLDGIISVYEYVLANFPADTQLLPGHGVVSPLSALNDQIAMIEAVREPVAAAKAEGKSLEEVLALGLTAEYDPRWSVGRWSGEYLVTTLYNAAP